MARSLAAVLCPSPRRARVPPRGTSRSPPLSRAILCWVASVLELKGPSVVGRGRGTDDGSARAVARSGTLDRGVACGRVCSARRQQRVVLGATDRIATGHRRASRVRARRGGRARASCGRSSRRWGGGELLRASKRSALGVHGLVREPAVERHALSRWLIGRARLVLGARHRAAGVARPRLSLGLWPDGDQAAVLLELRRRARAGHGSSLAQREPGPHPVRACDPSRWWGGIRQPDHEPVCRQRVASALVLGRWRPRTRG